MPAAQHRLWARCTNLDHPRFSLPQLIEAHPINHAVQLITAGTHPGDTADLASATHSYLVTGALGDIVHALVANDAWPREAELGGVTAVAIGPRLDETGGIAISPTGTLHLDVSGETYQALGLLGKRRQTAQGPWYHVEVNLTSKGCRVDQPYHNRVVERLNTLPGRCCLLVTIPVDNTTPHAAPDLALTTDLPTDNAISLPPQLTGLPSNSIQPAPVSTRSWAVSDVRMPALTRAALLGTAHSAAGVGGADAAGAAPMEVDDTIAVDPADMGATKRHAGQSGQASRSGVQGGPQGAMAAVVDGVHQWLGAMSCGFRGPAVDAMLPPQLTSTEQELSDSVHIHEWTGLLHNRMVLRTMLHAAQLMREQRCVWAAVSVWGWQDSPLSWEGQANATSAGGELRVQGEGTSHYTVLFMPSSDVLVLRAY